MCAPREAITDLISNAKTSLGVLQNSLGQFKANKQKQEKPDTAKQAAAAAKSARKKLEQSNAPSCALVQHGQTVASTMRALEKPTDLQSHFKVGVPVIVHFEKGAGVLAPTSSVVKAVDAFMPKLVKSRETARLAAERNEKGGWGPGR